VEVSRTNWPEAGDLTDLEAATNSLNIRVGDLETATNALDERATSLEGATNALDTRATNLEGATGALDTAVGLLQDATNALDGRATSLEGATNALDGRATLLEGATNALNANKLDKSGDTATDLTITGKYIRAISGTQTITNDGMEITTAQNFALVESDSGEKTASIAAGATGGAGIKIAGHERHVIL